MLIYIRPVFEGGEGCIYLLPTIFIFIFFFSFFDQAAAFPSFLNQSKTCGLRL